MLNTNWGGTTLGVKFNIFYKEGKYFSAQFS